MSNINKILKSFAISIGYIFLTSFLFAIVYSLTNKDDISFLVSYTLMIMIFILIYRKSLIEDIKNIKKDLSKNLLNITIFCIIFTLMMYIINIILYKLTGTIASNETLVRKSFLESPIIMGLNIILLGPITEELTYRYPYKNENNQKLITYIFYSIIFALTHITNIANTTELLFFIPYLLLSLCFGYGFYKSNNIYVSMIIHIINNLVNIMLLLI